MCKSDEELVIKSPIPRELEVTSTGKRKAPSGLVDKEIKVGPCNSLQIKH